MALAPKFLLCLAALLAGAGRLRADTVTTRSTFHCISLYWTRPEAGACTVEYRPRGEPAWQPAQNLWYDSEARTVRPPPRPASLPANDRWFDPDGGRRATNQYRGSLVNLRPGTDYEIRLSAGGSTELVRAATRSEVFKIKKVIPIGSQPTFATTEGGSEADGFVVYDGGGQAVIDAQDRHAHCVVIRHSHVIVRGLRLVNARHDALVVGDVRAKQALARTGIQDVVAIDRDVSDIVIEECDISQWGSLRVPELSRRWSQTEAGILVGSVVQRVVIQRNRIHRPRYTATRWNEQPGVAHPWGARGISLGHVSDREPWEANHVVRYNEIAGDDDHLLEDGICGGLNFSYTGAPGQDSDIYGNLITHATDDLIEADGGGMNVRIWGNYLADGFKFLSFQCLPLGPVYVFRNVFGGSREEVIGRRAASPFKFLSNERGSNGWRYSHHVPFNGPVYFYHNSLVHGDRAVAFETTRGGHLRHLISRNNIYRTATHFLRDAIAAGSGDGGGASHGSDFIGCSFDHDLHNQASSGDSVDPGASPHSILGEPRWRMGHGLISGAAGRFQLAAEAPGRNGGAALPNFNAAGREEGGAPDMGAHEFGSPEMIFGPKAKWLVP